VLSGATVTADEPLALGVDVVVIDGEACGDGVTAEIGTEEIPRTETPFGCEVVDVGADDDNVRLAKGMDEMTTLGDEVELVSVVEMEEVVVVDGMVNVDKEVELDTDAGGSPGVTVHCRTTCTRGWPFGPLIGVNVMLHVSVTGPALV